MARPPTPVGEEEVRFESDGISLAGTLMVAEGADGALPAVAFSHGWSGAVNERVLPLARRLAGSGYVALALDHRGFGRSEGRRARCHPPEQVRDLAHALSFLAAQSAVDPNGSGWWE
jgi:hypothetical protein